MDVDTLVDTEVEILVLALERVLETNVVGVLTLVEVEVDTLVDTDVEVLVLVLEYVFETDLVGVLPVAEVEVDTLVDADVEVLVLTLVDLLELLEVDTLLRKHPKYRYVNEKT